MAVRLLLGALAAVGAATLVACGPDTFEIPIETPIQPKLDVSAFQRVLVAGFVAGGNEDLDTNQETVRLLRSQLRNKSSLKVIDADVMPLPTLRRIKTRAPAAIPPRDRRLGLSGQRLRRWGESANRAAVPPAHQGRKARPTNGCSRTSVLEEERWEIRIR